MVQFTTKPIFVQLFFLGCRRWWISFIVMSRAVDLDPGSGALLTPGSGMGKISRSGSVMNILDHISESLETFFGVKILIFFDADADANPRSGILFDPGSGIWNEKTGICRCCVAWCVWSWWKPPTTTSPPSWRGSRLSTSREPTSKTSVFSLG